MNQPSSQPSRRSGPALTEAGFTLASTLLLAATLLAAYLGRMQASGDQGRVLVNSASHAQLSAILRIPASDAQRLTDYRASHGGFVSVDDLWLAPLLTRAEAEQAPAAAWIAGHGPLPSTSALAHLLHVSSADAARVLSTEQMLPPAAGPDGSLDRWRLALRETPLLDARSTRPFRDRLLLITPAQAKLEFLLASTLLLALMLLLPVWLRNRARVRGDAFLAPTALLLGGFGAAELFARRDPLRDPPVYLHHIMGLAIGAALFAALARLTPEVRVRFRRYLYVWLLAAVLLAALLWLFGHGPEGVRLSLFGFQPIELIKLMVVIFLCCYLADRGALLADSSATAAPAHASKHRGFLARLPSPLPRLQDLGPVVVLFCASLALFLAIRDLGPGLLLFATFIALLYMTTGQARYLAAGAVLAVAGGLFAYATHLGVFATRVDMWLSPFHNRHQVGMQLGQALWALSSSGWTGSGLGLGMPAAIPRGQDDLIFVAWTEETGLIGGLLALILFSVLVTRGIRIGMEARTDLDRTLAFGVTALLGFQTLLILCGALGLLPLTGLSAPFLCYGDSALLANFAVLGLLRSISAAGRSAQAPQAVRRAASSFAWGFAAVLVIGIGLCRLVQVQVLDADAIAARPIVTPDADGVMRPHMNPRLTAMAAAIQRGSIYDRAGRALATSRAQEIGQSDIPDRAALVQRGRCYPFGAALAPVVGWTDPLIGGPTGAEARFNSALRGYSRLRDLLPDYRRRWMPGFKSRVGTDVQLSIDGLLQQRAVAALKGRVQAAGGYGGALVALDPATGQMLVQASYPAVDPNRLTPAGYQQLIAAGPTGAARDLRHSAAGHPLVDRASRAFYPPGSALKVAVASIALDARPSSVRFQVACNRSARVRWQAGGVTYSRLIRDDPHDPSFGLITMPDAFRVSSNIYFANLAVQIGAPALWSGLTQDFQFSHVPALPRLEADLADVGYGQGRMLASPLEMACMAGSIAAGGVLMSPHVLLAERTGSMPWRPAGAAEPPSRAETAQTARLVGAMMRRVVTGGTAEGLFTDPALPVAGKTGTAQTGRGQPDSWFVGFAPYGGSPAVAFSCLVEHGGYGRASSAAACRDFLSRR